MVGTIALINHEHMLSGEVFPPSVLGEFVE